MINKNPVLKPYLKWAGGKRQILPEIRKHLPQDYQNRVYHEPFVGAGALLFDLQPKKAVINDTNSDLILTYRAIKDHIEELICLLKEHQRQNSKEYYYGIRALDREENYKTFSPVEKAARLIYLNRICYNGLYRVNAQGYFNVPYGRYKNPHVCEEDLLRSCHQYLNSADIVILNTDFEEAVSKAENNSFVYFDPPYHSSAKTGFNAYQAGGFDEAAQTRLRNVFLMLTKRRIPCLLSNADTPFIRDLYDDSAFQIITVTARRLINSDQSGRGFVNELLIKNQGVSQPFIML